MQITAKTKDLRAALDRITNMPGARSVNAFLVRLEAGMDGLTFERHSDSSIITTTCPCEVQAEGSLDIGFDALFRVIRQVPNEEVSLRQADSNLNVSSGRMFSKVAKAGEEQFTPLRLGESRSCFRIKLPVEDFCGWLRLVLPSASTNDAQSNYRGVIFDYDEDLILLATNGTWIQLIRTGIKEKPPQRFLLPTDAANPITKIFGHERGSATITITDRYLSIQTENSTFTSALVTEKIPNVIPMLKVEGEPLLTANRAELIAALHAGQPYGAGEKQALEFWPKGDRLILYGQLGETDFDYTLDAKCAKGSEVFMTPAGNLATSLGIINGDEVTLTRTKYNTICAKDEYREIHVCLCRFEPKRKE